MGGCEYSSEKSRDGVIVIFSVLISVLTTRTGLQSTQILNI